MPLSFPESAVVPAFLEFCIALAVGALFAWPIFQLLLKLKARQTVSQFLPEHQVKQGTPTMGGILILVGVAAGLMYRAFDESAWSMMFLIYLFTFAAIGFVDDFVVPRLIKGKRGLGWGQKLIFELICAGLVPSFALLNSARADTLWQAGLTVFLVLFFANAYNFADGLDGLAGGLLIFLAGGLIAMGALVGAIGAVIAGAALLGGVIPFLFLNAPPAKLFMGDVGSLPIGAVLGLGVIDIYTSSLKRGLDSFGILMALALFSFILIAELLPPPIQILSVKLLKRRILPKTPIHHAFEDKGIPETRIVWGFHLVQLVGTVMAVGLLASLVVAQKP